MPQNSAFSSELPQLQTFWDSTSIGALKTCPRLYYFSIIQGWQSRHKSVHLSFGEWYHKALETYDHAKFSGASHEDALDSAVAYALRATWDEVKGRPWLSDEPSKNRLTLLRTIVWYLDEFREDTMETLKLSNGKPAVELSFRFETSFGSDFTGEQYYLCGHLDRVATLGDQVWILDRKTSKSALDDRFYESFTPDDQFTLYTLAGQIVWELPTQGIIIDAAQIGATFSRFGRQQAPRPQSILEEWYAELGMWLKFAELCAERGKWPANPKSCGNYAGCAFRPICSKPPGVREEWLRAGFTKRVWNPREPRGKDFE